MNAETLLDQAEGLVSAVGDEPVAEPQAAGGAGEAAEGRKRTRFLSEVGIQYRQLSQSSARF